MSPFGTTRSVILPDHALITPESHVPTPLAGWEQTSGIILISPQTGAQFVQYLAHLTEGSHSNPAPTVVERFVYVRAGEVQVVGATTFTLQAGGYAYLPPACPSVISGQATLLVFEKIYEPRTGFDPPAMVHAQEQDVAALAFQGDPDARLKTLLPADNPAFDLAINIFTYQPGATLPNVEVHVMEHGLMMLAGAGVYRLGQSYYPVQKNDVIWMAPYCPQWFVAMGKTPARYIYYKDMHRDPLLSPTRYRWTT